MIIWIRGLESYISTTCSIDVRCQRESRKEIKQRYQQKRSERFHNYYFFKKTTRYYSAALKLAENQEV